MKKKEKKRKKFFIWDIKKMNRFSEPKHARKRDKTKLKFVK